MTRRKPIANPPTCCGQAMQKRQDFWRCLTCYRETRDPESEGRPVALPPRP